MDPRNLPARLTTEQVYAFGKIIQDGSLLNLSGATYLVVPVSSMTIDLLKGARLPEFANNILHNRSELNLPTTVPHPKQSPDQGITLEELSIRFLADMKVGGSVSNCETYQRIFRYLSEILGRNRRVKTIGREDMLKIRDLIIDLPFNHRPRVSGMSVMEAIERTRSENLQRISLTTINHYLLKIATIFNWAERQWLIDRNPAKRLRRNVGQSPPGFKRRPFTMDELNRLFLAPVFSGCIDDRVNFKKPGPNHPRHERFWVPLIGLFSGLRVNEICQMDVADVEEVNGILAFHVTNIASNGERDKRIKTRAADRYVPVHPELIRIGFLDYVAKARQEGRRKLFPRFKRGVRESYAHSISIWFSQLLLKSIGIYTPETTFHSFRHTFRDALRRSNASLYVMKELCGWSLPQPGLAFGYGSLLSMKDLAKAIWSVKYPGLDLSHLYVTVTPRLRRKVDGPNRKVTLRQKRLKAANPSVSQRK